MINILNNNKQQNAELKFLAIVSNRLKMACDINKFSPMQLVNKHVNK